MVFSERNSRKCAIGTERNTAYGAEMQVMIQLRWSAQLGAGIHRFSGGFNYHIYPTVSSPYISVQAWQRGFGTVYQAAYAGPMFVDRASRLLQADLGEGYQIHKNRMQVLTPTT